jgi:tRNA-specific 2-thiouridylase
MRTSIDSNKDQTYFLFGLTQAQLARTLFPLGGMAKPQVRELAKELGLPVAEKNDSQEICFVPGGDYANFIKAYLAEQGRELPEGAGEIVDTSGRVMGTHAGTHRFTIGQRRGLGVAAGEPLYVISTDPVNRRVQVGRDRELMAESLTARGVNWLSIDAPREPCEAQVKIRNKHTPAEATLMPSSDPTRVEVRFRQPQRAITPGQAAVFYDDDLVLGGGWIV